MGALVGAQEKKVKEYKDTGWRYPTQVRKYKRDCLTCNLHPIQKPLELLINLVKTFSNENDLILDNCMGSGTTGVVGALTNRNFVGIEKDTNYYNIAKKRIEETLKK